MEFALGGLKGGELNTGDVELPLKTRGSGAGEIGKIARTTPAEDGHAADIWLRNLRG